MQIKEFQVEQWMNTYETRARYNIAETCVDSVSLEELFSLAGEDLEGFWRRFSARRLTYGDIVGHPEFLKGVCGLYRTLSPEHVIPTHGAAGANSLLLSALVEPGDHVIAVMPTYQQLYSIPESLGARVEILRLRREEGYLPNLDTLGGMLKPTTKLICINNPNNPTGALMDGELLGKTVDMARQAGAYLLCDEVYRHLNQGEEYIPSIADLYEKGISTGSMSKTFSLAGLRQGWIATRNAGIRRACLCHRDYNLISSGLFDEEVAAVALAHRDKLLARSRGIVRTNLERLHQWVVGEPCISYLRPAAGTTALLHYDLEQDSYEFCRSLLEQTGVLLTPGDCFGQSKSLRIGYACAAKELEEGLAGLHDFLFRCSR